MKKKYSRGEATWYMTRKQALNKLQVNLRDFRRLCIMKGIYPREPIKRTRAQKGSTEPKTLYYKKDIQFLLHEPMIWQMWNNKALHKKISKSVAKGDYAGSKRLRLSRPKYKLDHIVKERYPTFSDALNDVDDAMTLCSLFAIMPAITRVPGELVADCRRITVEFLHYVIEARALRKAFISIKGYYFEADIQGQTVHWMMPHHFVYTRPENVDLRVMAIFCEFYVTLMGFVVFRLFHSLSLNYPPKLSITDSDGCIDGESMSVSELNEERVAALNCPLSRIPSTVDQEADDEEDEEELALMSLASGDSVQQIQLRRQKIKNIRKMFEGCKFFLNREVPREPFILLIRSLGGQCSWDANTAPGATFPEHDQTITHHIIDRNAVTNKYTSRYYIQPQWVFDSLNAGQLRPVQLYFPGVELPPHLSPFKEEEVSWGEYVPPDKLKLLDELAGIKPEEETSTSTPPIVKPNILKESKKDQNSEGPVGDKSTSKKKKKSDSLVPAKDGVMCVKPGVVERVNAEREKMRISREEFTLRSHMVKKKDRYKFNKLMQRKKRMEKQARELTERRKQIDLACAD